MVVPFYGMLFIKRVVLCFLLASVLGFACARADAAGLAASADSTASMPGSPGLLQETQSYSEVGFSPSRSFRAQNGASAEHGTEAFKEQRPRWMLLTVFLLFLAIGAIWSIFPGDFATIVRAFYQEQRFRHISHTDNTLTSWPYVFLFLVFSLVLGLFIVLVEPLFGLQGGTVAVDRFLETALAIGSLFVLKILCTRLVGPVFGLDRLARKYIAVLYLLYFNAAFFLMPFLLTSVFAPDRYTEPVLISSGAIAIVPAYRFLKAVLGLFRNLKFSVLYLILYLCALEVVPVIVLIKVLGK